jgi:ABC-type multidrug transport system ATPase subunit
MRNLILMLSKELGKTVLISSHLLSEIEVIANRMIIIHKGQKKIEGSVTELLDPAHTMIDIDSTDNVAAREKIAASKWASYLQQDKALQLMMNRTAVPSLIKDMVAMDIELLSVNSSHSLENYFLSLTTNSGYVAPFAN